MAQSTTSKSSPGSLFIPILAALNFMLVSILPMSSVSVLFGEIARDLQLNVVQIGSTWGMLSLGAIFVTPFGGVLCDHLGTKRTIVLLGSLTGLICALIGLSNGFMSLMVTAFLWGMLSSAIIPALNIAASQSSSSQRQGLAQGLLAAGAGVGLTIGSLISATLLSPLIGGWRHVLFLYGGAAILYSLFWQLRIKEPERIKPAGSGEKSSIRQAFAYLFRLKAVWLIGFSVLTYQCCTYGMVGFLPYFLASNGWDVAASSGALAAYTVASAIGVIPLCVLSDKIGSRKIPLLAMIMSAVIGIGLLSIIHGQFLWVLVILAGTFYGLSGALFTTLCIETKGVGIMYSGTAVGITLAIGAVGKAFSPPLGNSLANISTTIAWPFVLWAGFGVISAVILIFIKETGWRAEGKSIPES